MIMPHAVRRAADLAVPALFYVAATVHLPSTSCRTRRLFRMASSYVVKEVEPVATGSRLLTGTPPSLATISANRGEYCGSPNTAATCFP